MKKFSKILSVTLAIMMVISIVPITASATTYVGQCGDDLMWSYSTENHTLTISGEGDMPNYSVDTYTSWRRNGYDIKNVIIRSDVTSIGDYAFYDCGNLTSITIPNKVTRIGNGAFLNCTGLTSVTIGYGVSEIGESAFSICYNITDVYYTGTEEEWNAISIGANNDILFNANLTFIPSDVCGENTTWHYDEATCTLTISGTGAMYDYEYNNRPWEEIEDDIRNVVIDNGVTTIGELAFAHCDNLISVTIPDSVAIIGESAFCGCDNLSNVTIPDSVTTMGDSAFDYCTGLTSIAIPDSVTTMGNSVFSACSNLTSVTIGDGVKKNWFFHIFLLQWSHKCNYR